MRFICSVKQVESVYFVFESYEYESIFKILDIPTLCLYPGIDQPFGGYSLQQ